jgi:ribonucleoside-diphosphate reductase alpha chain
MNATLNFDNSDLLEVRINNSNGGCSAMYQGLGMMASEALRLGGDPERIAEQLNQVTCPANMKKEGCHGKSCPDALGRLIKNAVRSKQDVIDFVKNETPKREYTQDFAPTENKGMTKCKECGEMSYVNESSCGICRNCGYSACK